MTMKTQERDEEEREQALIDEANAMLERNGSPLRVRRTGPHRGEWIPAEGADFSDIGEVPTPNPDCPDEGGTDV
jgi:hypothetical protein